MSIKKRGKSSFCSFISFAFFIFVISQSVVLNYTALAFVSPINLK